MKKRSLYTAAAVAAGLALLVTYSDPALAQGVFGTLQEKGSKTFQNVRNLSFLIGGFGVIGLAVMAYFGRFQFKWLFALVGGLVLIASAGSAIDYVTQDTSDSVAMPSGNDFGDTLAR